MMTKEKLTEKISRLDREVSAHGERINALQRSVNSADKEASSLTNIIITKRGRIVQLQELLQELEKEEEDLGTTDNPLPTPKIKGGVIICKQKQDKK